MGVLTTPTPQAPQRVTSLPTDPFDGQEVYYVADAANGVIWHLAYRAASTSPYKWEFLGGGSLWAEGTVSVGTNSTTYQDTGTQVTLPLAGDYELLFGGKTYSESDTASHGVWVRLAVGTTQLGHGILENWVPSASGTGVRISHDKPIRALGRAAGDVVKMQLRTASAGTMSITDREISAKPTRVG